MAEPLPPGGQDPTVEKQAAPPPRSPSSPRPTSSATVVVEEQPSALAEKGDEKGSPRVLDELSARKAPVDERNMKVAVRKHWCGSIASLLVYERRRR
jgi:hypothetical protein